MYSSIVGVLGACTMTLIYYYILNIPKYLREREWSIKPLNCGFCMSFWFCFIYQLSQNNLMDAIFISSIAPFLYLFIEDKFLEKWVP